CQDQSLRNRGFLGPHFEAEGRTVDPGAGQVLLTRIQAPDMCAAKVFRRDGRLRSNDGRVPRALCRIFRPGIWVGHQWRNWWDARGARGSRPRYACAPGGRSTGRELAVLRHGSGARKSLWNGHWFLLSEAGADAEQTVQSSDGNLQG